MSDYRRKQAWDAGQRAFRNGKPRSSCNRMRATIFYDDWMDGYEDAEHSALVLAVGVARHD